MKTIQFGKSDLQVPNIALGCMRIATMEVSEVQNYIDTALELGMNFFDHADIYGAGECETVFGKALNNMEIKREDLFIQSKCSIIPGVMYDCSKEHIIRSVDKILKRLDIDYLDSLLIHRPDALMDPEEVAFAFDVLEQYGKVRSFGVSNHKSSQIKLLQKYMKQPIMSNQLQLSITNCDMISNGINVNTSFDKAIDRDDSILDFCRLEDITIQAWSPFQFGFFEGVFLGNEKYATLNKVIATLAKKYDVTDSAIAVAWILRHPAKIQTIVGSTNIERLKEISKASDIELSRKDWYIIYQAAGNELP